MTNNVKSLKIFVIIFFLQFWLGSLAVGSEVRNEKIAACVASLTGLEGIGSPEERAEARERLFTRADYVDDLDLRGVKTYNPHLDWSVLRSLDNTLNGELVSVEVRANTSAGLDQVFVRGEVIGSSDNWQETFILREHSTGKEYTFSFKVPAPSGERTRFIELIPMGTHIELEKAPDVYSAELAAQFDKDAETLKKRERLERKIAIHRRAMASDRNQDTRRIHRFKWKIKRLAERGEINSLIDLLRPLFADVEASVLVIKKADREIPQLKEDLAKIIERDGFNQSPEAKELAHRIDAYENHRSEAFKILSRKDRFRRYQVARLYIESVLRHDDRDSSKTLSVERSYAERVEGNSNDLWEKLVKTVRLAYAQIRTGWSQVTTFPGLLGREDRPALWEVRNTFHRPEVLLPALQKELMYERLNTLRAFAAQFPGLFRDRLDGFLMRTGVPEWFRQPLATTFQSIKISKMKRRYLDEVIGLDVDDVPVERKVNEVLDIVAEDRDNEFLELLARLAGMENLWDSLYAKTKNLYSEALEKSDQLTAQRYKGLLGRMDRVLEKINDKGLQDISVDHATPPINKLATTTTLLAATGIYHQTSPLGENDPVWQTLDYVALRAVELGQTLGTVGWDVIQWALKMVGA